MIEKLRRRDTARERPELARPSKKLRYAMVLVFITGMFSTQVGGCGSATAIVDLRITFLSVGEGDAAVVRFPGARVMVIDGGSAWRDFDLGERVVARYLWSQKIMHVDSWLASHPDRDHFAGLIFIARSLCRRSSGPAASTAPTIRTSNCSMQLRKLERPNPFAIRRHRRCSIGGVSVRCVGPLAGREELKENNSSMVIRLDYGRDAILFPGDVEAKGERELSDAGADLRSTVLKVPHHGSRTSSSEPFLKAVAPRVAVISLGYQNRFSFPADEVLQRYYDAGVTILRTDEDGAISADAGIDSLSLRQPFDSAQWLCTKEADRPVRTSRALAEKL